MSRKNRKNLAPASDAAEIAAFVDDAPASDAPAIAAPAMLDAIAPPAVIDAPPAPPADAPADIAPATRPTMPHLRGGPVHPLFVFSGGVLNTAPNGRDVATDSLLHNASVAANLSATTAARADRTATLNHAARLLAYAYSAGPASLGACPAPLLPFSDDTIPPNAAAVPFAETRGAHFDTTRVSDLDYAASAARAAARLMYRCGVRYVPAGSFGSRNALPAAFAPIVNALTAALASPT